MLPQLTIAGRISKSAQTCPEDGWGGTPPHPSIRYTARAAFIASHVMWCFVLPRYDTTDATTNCRRVLQRPAHLASRQLLWYMYQPARHIARHRTTSLKDNVLTTTPHSPYPRCWGAASAPWPSAPGPSWSCTCAEGLLDPAQESRFKKKKKLSGCALPYVLCRFSCAYHSWYHAYKSKTHNQVPGKYIRKLCRISCSPRAITLLEDTTTCTGERLKTLHL